MVAREGVEKSFMRYYFFCTLLFFLFVVSAADHRNGINFLNGQWSSPKYNSAEAAASLTSIQNQTNANWLALTYCSFQWSVDSSGPIYAKPSTPTSIQLSAIVNESKSRKLKIFFRPCIDPDWSNPETEGTWRGEIGRNFNTSDWDRWFGFYKAFITTQAALAQKLRVDMFSVGMEYVVPSTQEAHWRSVVAAVRAVYRYGPITYCANHGNEGLVRWWDVVDEISVDAYYPLAPSSLSPTVTELVQAWQPIVLSLAQLSVANGDKPINFGEIGYCSVTGANTDPAHCGLLETKLLNLTAQANLYSAFFEAVFPQPWFKGVFWWAWVTDSSDGGPANVGFTPSGKPAAQIIAKYF
jgi:hypothetical protein